DQADGPAAQVDAARLPVDPHGPVVVRAAPLPPLPPHPTPSRHSAARRCTTPRCVPQRTGGDGSELTPPGGAAPGRSPGGWPTTPDRAAVPGNSVPDALARRLGARRLGARRLPAGSAHSAVGPC